MAKKIEKAQHSKTATAKHTAVSHTEEKEFPFSKENYVMFGIGTGLIILGLLLMSGTEDVMSFRKLHLSTIVMLAGYIFNIYAIMKRPKIKE
jgi:hypothetical protein